MPAQNSREDGVAGVQLVHPLQHLHAAHRGDVWDRRDGRAMYRVRVGEFCCVSPWTSYV